MTQSNSIHSPQPRFPLAYLFGLVLAVPVLTTTAARADTVCGDKTCPKGYACETVDLGCATIDLACPEGTECKPATCTPSQQQVCRPATCTTDADCGTDMLCNASEQLECSGEPATPACARGSDCTVDDVAPPESSCTSKTVHQCAPRWTLPCQTAADCGAGFNCVDQQSCWCSGSKGTPSTGTAVGGSATGGSAPVATLDAPLPAEDPTSGRAPSTEPECGCSPNGVKACEMIQTACATDADCLSGWTCKDNSNGTCWASSDGRSGCTPADPPRYCVPPYSDLGNANYGRTASADLAGEDSAGVSQGGGVVSPQSAPETKGSSADAGTSSATPGSTKPPVAAPTPAGNSADPEPATTPSAAGGGCSLASMPQGHNAALAWLGLALGAVLSLRRRR